MTGAATVAEVIEVALPGRGYPVVVGAGLLGALARLGRPVPVGGDDVSAQVAGSWLPPDVSRAMVVTQSAVVDAGHVAPVESALRELGVDVHRHVVPDGESAKSVAVLERLWHAAAERPLSRADVIVAVGGGVVGDLAGFAAATFNRGIRVVQVPTTLLGQVDAAIGGKTGINLPHGKNLVGAFHQPAAVVCDVSTLVTLPERILREGLGEVVKYGLIADPAVLELLERRPDAARSGEQSLLSELVVRSARVKAQIVAGDEREAGRRAHLNLGHTYGHAVESLTGYAEVLHGEAVAIGTVVALRLGVRLGRTSQDVARRGEALLERLGLPVRGPRLDRDEVWTALGRDKKASRGQVRFVVLDELAAPAVVTPERADVDAVLDDLHA